MWQHEIMWFTYKTKFMEEWPVKSVVLYDDGTTTPMVIVNDDQKIVLEFQLTNYQFNKNKLKIHLGKAS